MKTITIITPANIEVRYRLAGAGSRMAAFLVDLIIQLAAILLSAWIVLSSAVYFGGTALAFVIVSAFVIHFGYFIVWELASNGQSIGKRLLGLRVLRENGRPVEFSHVLVRGLLRSGVDMMYVGLFVILFSRKHQRLGDMAAGTVVVIEKRAEIADTLIIWPENFPDAEAMTPEERHLVEHWLRRRSTLPDGGAVLGKRLELYFNTKED